MDAGESLLPAEMVTCATLKPSGARRRSEAMRFDLRRCCSSFRSRSSRSCPRTSIATSSSAMPENRLARARMQLAAAAWSAKLRRNSPESTFSSRGTRCGPSSDWSATSALLVGPP